jgi:hypothetical protein
MNLLCYIFHELVQDKETETFDSVIFIATYTKGASLPAALW